MISQCGAIFWMRFPMVWAASFQSVCLLPSPQVGEPSLVLRISLRRSMPMTLGLVRYFLASSSRQVKKSSSL